MELHVIKSPIIFEYFDLNMSIMLQLRKKITLRAFKMEHNTNKTTDHDNLRAQKWNKK